MKRRALTVLVLAICAACSGNDPEAQSPSSSPSATASAMAAPVVSGSGTVSISGQESFRMELPVAAADSRFAPEGGDFTFIFKDPDNNLLSLGGDWFEGTRKTSGRLVVSLVFNRENVIAHTDSDGGCEVTLKRSGGGVEGSVRCEQIEGGRYAAEANFRIVTR